MNQNFWESKQGHQWKMALTISGSILLAVGVFSGPMIIEKATEFSQARSEIRAKEEIAEQREREIKITSYIDNNPDLSKPVIDALMNNMVCVGMHETAVFIVLGVPSKTDYDNHFPMIWKRNYYWHYYSTEQFDGSVKIYYDDETRFVTEIKF